MYGDNIFVAPSLIPPAQGRRDFSDLLNGKSNRFLQIFLAADITISVAVITAIRNGGHVAALFEEIGINEGGTDVCQGDPLLFAFASEVQRQSAGSEGKLASTAVGLTNLRQMFRIYFENPYMGAPHETAYMEKSIQSKLRFFCKYSNTPIPRICTVGGATVVFANVQVFVDQYFDDAEDKLPLFRPTWDTVIQPIGGAGAAIPIYLPLDMNTFLRGITFTGSSVSVGQQTDIINRIRITGDRYNYIGPEPMNIDRFARGMEFEQGGNTYAAEGLKMFHMGFQKNGRLSTVMTPVQDSNLRMLMDALPSVASGVNDSQIVVLRHLLVRDPYVGPDGRRVTMTQADFAAALPKV